MINIIIGNKLYNVLEAKTKEERKEGLKNLSELDETEGMLFYMPGERPLYLFTMEEVKIPLDIIFINQDLEVVFVSLDCLPDLKSIINSLDNVKEDDYIAYVLEVNSDSGIKVGDTLDFEEDAPIMKVLFPDGSEQMALYGGERIFSRKNTRVLIKKAKKAAESLSDADYKALGKYMFKCIKIQDEREPEYVTSPKKD